MLKYLVVLFIFLLKISSFAVDSDFDSLVEDLICEKLVDKSLTVEISYESKEKIEKIRSKHQEINEISLVRFDANYSNFKARISYRDNSVDEICSNN